MNPLTRHLSGFTAASPSSPDLKINLALNRLERQLTAASGRMDSESNYRMVLAEASHDIATAHKKLISGLPPKDLPKGEQKLAELLDKCIMARPLDVRWRGLMHTQATRIWPAVPSVVNNTDAAESRIAAQPSIDNARGRPSLRAPSASRAAAAAPTSKSVAPPLPPPTRSLTAEERRARAVELSSRVTFATTDSGRQMLVHTDGTPGFPSQKIKLDLAFSRPLVLPSRNRTKRREFRVSYLPSTGFGELVMGSMMTSGSFAKARPAVLVQPDGTRKRVLVKEQRISPRRNTHKKSRFNSLGHQVTNVIAQDAFDREAQLMQAAGGPAKLIGTYAFDDKVLMVMEYMDGGNLHDLPLTIDERGPMARLAAAQLAAHSKEMHAQNIVHGDGKGLNALVNLASGQIGHSDFGHSQRLDKSNHRYTKAIATYASPESVRHQGVTTQHDSWTLGVTALEVLTGDAGYPDALQVYQQNPNTPEDKEARRRIYSIEQLRAWLMPVESGEATSAQGVSLERLRSPKLAERGALGALLSSAAARDEDLTAYVIARLLDPNEQTRDTAAQAHEALSQLATSQKTQTDATFARLRAQAARMPDQRLFERLEVALERIESKLPQ